MTDEVEEKTPEWLLRLESRKRKPRLAHEIGAGALCLVCGDGCPGLDLHFWRKLCRNCKCKKEDHDVKDDDGYEQFEILLGTKKRKLGGVLKFKIPDAEKPSETGKANIHVGNVKFDWVPPDVSDDVASEYMRQIPVGKLPISGSDGAVYRRQQLEKQVPLHDLDASKCHNLSAEEVEGLMQYLNNLKNNVVGQGKVTKVPVLYREYVIHNAVPHQSCGFEAVPTASSMTASTLYTSQPAHARSLPPSFNAAPRPFHPSIANSDSDFPPPPPPLETETAVQNPSGLNLKMPSAFVPHWKPSEAGHTVIPYNPGYNVAHSTESAANMQPLVVGKHQMPNTGAPLGLEIQRSHKPELVNAPAQFLHGSAGHPDQIGTSLHEGSVLTSAHPYQVQHSSEMSNRPNPSFSQQVVGKAGSKTVPEAQSQESIIAASKFPSGMAISEIGKKQFPQQTQPYTDNRFHGNSSDNKATVYSDVSNHNVGAPFAGTNLNDFDTSNLPSNLAYLGAVDGEGNSILPNSYLKDSSNVSAPHRVIRDVPPFSKNVTHSEVVGNSTFPQHLACSCVIPASHNPGEILPLDPKCALHHPQGHNDVRNTSAYNHPHEHNADMRNVPAYNHPHEHKADMQNIPAYPSHLVHSQGYPSQLTHSQGPLSCYPPQEFNNDSVCLRNKATGIGAIHEPVISSTFPENSLSENVRAPYGIDVAHSTSVGSDGMPRSAHVMQNAGHADKGLAEQLAQLSGLGGEEHPVVMEQALNCQECKGNIHSGDVAVFAERAGGAPWHPQCFVCHTCKELLVDLMYFYHKGYIYCGRHYADLLHIPRCFACDELIFVKEYTMAEGKAFHVKHFCCYECDVPLGGMKYILKDEQPVCLDCYQEKYGKRCHTCKKMIAAGDQRVTLKELNWHATAECFCCYQCKKSLLGGKMVVKQERPFCSKECVQLGLSS